MLLKMWVLPLDKSYLKIMLINGFQRQDMKCFREIMKPNRLN